MNLQSLDRWARIKGIKVMGTGDFTHPLWFGELKEQLEPAEPGLFKFKGQNGGTRFLLTAEISCIYSKGGRQSASLAQGAGSVRKVHIVVLAPSFDAAEKINVQLGWVGNLMADGRPILGLDAKELARIVLGVSEHCLVVPGHAMTPWFGVFGSKSGFNSLQECFEELTPQIYAVETGLSADPSMLWRIPDGQRVALISNSDAHSPQKIGREVNIFDTDLSYEAIETAIKTKDPKKFLYTIEFFPEEGKYHLDGHRLCNVSFSPEDSKKNNNLCPASMNAQKMPETMPAMPAGHPGMEMPAGHPGMPPAADNRRVKPHPGTGNPARRLQTRRRDPVQTPGASAGSDCRRPGCDGCFQTGRHRIR